VHQGTCGSGTVLACNDDTDGCGVTDGTANAGRHGSVVDLPVTAGQTYYLIVDGYNGRSGNFSLGVIPPS
jgi:hypothetical protein